LSRYRLHLLAWCVVFFVDPSLGQTPPLTNPIAGNEQIENVFKTFEGRGVQADDSQPTPPPDALQTFQVRSGLSIDLVAHEPEVSQPLFLTWDSRGRLWVAQYRQYQYPAGLKVVQFDQHLRAVFDRVPEPPPQGPTGADKISVLEDLDGDGRLESLRDVITGLNIATSMQIGQGGIWVLNPPYLLFYPDADGDDVPDAKPEVHLSGFGLQDTHSVANSLLWGPDGWLYGANGSTTGGTVSSKVTKGIAFEGQCIWRYHPKSHVFEIYAEGGGNTFSLEIDSQGQVFSGTNGGGTRGYFYPQGSYSEKNWGKHGALTNPFAFGYFPAMKMEGDPRRFAQAFAIYEGGLLTEPYAGTIIAPNSLHNLVWNSRLIRDGATYRTIDQENLLTSRDRWFRPVYCGIGPDGAVYLADWYDTRLSHVNPVDDWHKESGRIYRVRPTESQPVYPHGDLSRLSTSRLVELFEDKNKWVRQRAVLELGWRGDLSIEQRLVSAIEKVSSLEALWALNLLDRLTSARAGKWLNHPNASVRRWVVRLLGDRQESHPGLVDLASTESDIQVRSQLAATAKRLNAKAGLEIVANLTRYSEDADDPHQPLMIWWALEIHADEFESLQAWLNIPDTWSQPLFREYFLGRLIQRYASRSREGDLERCEKIMQSAPDEAASEIIISAIYRAFQGRSVPGLPKALDTAMLRYQDARGSDGLVLALRAGAKGADKKAISTVRDTKADLGLRIELTKTLSGIRLADSVSVLLKIATSGSEDPSLRRAAMSTLASYDNDQIPKTILGSFYSSISNEHDLRASACRTLVSRAAWAPLLVNEVLQWRLSKRDVPDDVVQQLRTYHEEDLRADVEKAFGPPVAIAAPEKLAELERLTAQLTTLTGDSNKGRALFGERCGNCHRLFGNGATVGPPLDGYDRANLAFWLPAILDPSLEIREGYQSQTAITFDGRSVTGMLVGQTPQTVTLKTAENRDVTLVQEEIEDLRAMPQSLMPEGLLKDLTDAQIANLFAYLSLGTTR
jgi:putative heme-binding domain-containing protein